MLFKDITYIITFTIYISNILYNQIYESAWWCCKNPLDIPDQLSELTSPSLSSANRIGTAGHWTGESRVPATGSPEVVRLSPKWLRPWKQIKREQYLMNDKINGSRGFYSMIYVNYK
jgi:hypothetical protein